MSRSKAKPGWMKFIYHAPPIINMNIPVANSYRSFSWPRTIWDSIQILIIKSLTLPFQLFSKCNRIQCLDLSFCHQILTPTSNLHLLPTTITKLVLGGLQVDGEKLVEAVTRLPKLEDLQLCGINTLTDDHLKEVGNSLSCIQQLPNTLSTGEKRC